MVGKIEECANAANTRCWRFRQIVKRFQTSERRRLGWLSGRGGMTTRDDDLRIRPGRIQHANRAGKRPQTFVTGTTAPPRLRRSAERDLRSDLIMRGALIPCIRPGMMPTLISGSR